MFPSGPAADVVGESPRLMVGGCVLVAEFVEFAWTSCFGNGVGWDGGIAKCGVRESGERNMGVSFCDRGDD